MRRQTINVKRVVRVLTDAQPEFVSLVNHGANQTPFKVVKSAGSQPVDIQKITFDKSVFTDEAAVQEFLATRSYVDFTINTTDAGFEVQSPDEFEDGLETIHAQKGVTMTVGRIRTRKSAAATPAPEAVETETVEKAAEVTAEVNPGSTEPTTETKASEPAAPEATTETPAAEPETAAKAAEPAAPEPEQAKKGVYEFSELTYLVRGLVWLANDRRYDEALNGAQAGMADALRSIAAAAVPVLQAFADEAVADIAALTQKSAETTTETKAAEPAAPEAAPEAQTADTSTEVAKGAETAEVTAEGATDAEAAQKAGSAAPEPATPAATSLAEEVAKALAALLPAALAPVVKAVEDVKTSTETKLTEVAETATKAASRVEAVEVATSRQTRKSGDIEEVSATGTQAPQTSQKDAERAKKALRDRLGI